MRETQVHTRAAVLGRRTGQWLSKLLAELSLSSSSTYSSPLYQPDSFFWISQNVAAVYAGCENYSFRHEAKRRITRPILAARQISTYVCYWRQSIADRNLAMKQVTISVILTI